jgi:hypothetical protein
MMLPAKQSLLEAIETVSEDVLEDLLGFLKSRLSPQLHPQRRKSFTELQKICQEEDYALDTAARADRENPFLEEI